VEGDDAGLVDSANRPPGDPLFRTLLGDLRVELPLHAAEPFLPVQPPVVELGYRLDPVASARNGCQMSSAAGDVEGWTAMGGHSVAIVTLGCARNEVDSEELAGRLSGEGFELIADPAAAETVLVNTCGFIEQAKKDSIDAVLAAADIKTTGRTRSVVAVGCLAERYGATLADELAEADAVLGFDDYQHIGRRLTEILSGREVTAHVPRDRRRLLPLAPVDRPGPVASPRRRLDDGPVAPLRIASGCDRRCSFCAIPRFRGAFVSRRPGEVLDDARWLAQHGVREVFLVSENTTSYGKDLGDLRLLETVLAKLTTVDGIERVRLSYLQPAELRPTLIDAVAITPGVTPYFDLSFQHASPAVLRRMRRFGSAEPFLDLIDTIRKRSPAAGIRSNVIVGFPGETEADLAILESFLAVARLDAVGVFGYSDEDGTEAASFDGKLSAEEIAERVERVDALAEDLVAQRAEDRVGEQVAILIESVGADAAEGRADHQGPDVDGTTTLTGCAARVGDLVAACVVGSVGADLVAVAAAG
jgi:ribosomal protein S12 methylthiotransferase